jgi:hypothetical protein
MKNVLMAILATIIMSGCGLYKKTTNTEKSKETTEKTSVTTKDSTSRVQKSQPTDSQITMDIESLSRMIGDFTQRITSGDGNESVIEKKGGTLTVRNHNAGSTKEQTKVKDTKSETEYNSEYIFKESKKIVSRLPWWIWLALIVWVLIMFRKFIAQLIVILFPGTATFRLMQVLIGTKIG